MRERTVAVGLGVAASVVLIAAFLLTHERVEVDAYLPPSGEAGLNPLLAAERLLQELGYNVTSEVEFVPRFEMPANGDTALLLFDYRGLQQDDLETLLGWVGRGGHLIVQIEPKYGRAYDPVFTPLDIEVSIPEYDMDFPIEASRDAPAGADDETPSEADASTEPDPPPFESFPGRDYWGDMRLDNKRHIDFGPNETIWSVADENGVFAGQIGYEQGLLTVVADLSFTTNFWIGDGDHAFILTRLIGEPEDSGKVWLYYGRRFPSLASVIWEKAGFLIKGGALVLLLVLWRATGRFGPEIPSPPRARKAFLEHITANGRFLWRRHQEDVLVSKTQRSFLRDFARRHPGSRHLDEDDRSRAIAEICDMEVEKVDNALRAPRGRSHHDFTDKMQLLRSLWTRI